jgi:nucleoside-diphosphate-sugar epimerase
MILVTGASGHLGRPLVEELLGRGEEVRIFDRNIDPLPEGAEAVKGDLLNLDELREAAEGADVIYHLAAIVNYGSVSRKLMYDVNVNGTRNVLACSKARTLIYPSSTAVYGNRMKDNPATEGTAIRPSTYYGRTKAEAEGLVLRGGGIVLRFPVIYGHGFNNGFDYVLSRMEAGRMRLIGKGDNLIQWIHVNDLVQALLLAKDKGKSGEVYLAAGKESRTQRQLFALLAERLNVSPPDRSIPGFLANSMARLGMIAARLKGKEARVTPELIARITSSRLYDISKAERELGFHPQMSYEQGAREIVEEYLQRKGQGPSRSRDPPAHI